MKYLPRAIEKPLLKAARQFPAVMLTGPRQSGKTTLLKHLFARTHTYVSLDDADLRRIATDDPGLFLQSYPPPVIIDEIQYAPGLLSGIKEMVDGNRSAKGRFILTGSQVFPLMQGVGETLAGRIGIFTLLPLSLMERFSSPDRVTLPVLKKALLRGAYPEIALQKSLDHHMWYTGYVQTYMERDIRHIRQVGNLGDYQRFLQLLAARNGQVMNQSIFSRDLGIAVNTVKAWVSLLETTGQVYSVRPYYNNKGKRLVKSPKVYLTDTGLACYLTGMETERQVLQGPFAGQLLESLVLSELLKRFHNAGRMPRIYYWRTSNGQEVDFIVEQHGRLLPIEVKLGTRANTTLAKGLLAFIADYRDSVDTGMLLNLGTHPVVLGDTVKSVPLKEFLFMKKL